ILYSSTGFTYQSADEPRNKEVIDREDLDAVVMGAHNEFEAIVRLLNYASRRWVYAGPRLEYPKWNAVDIAERAHSFGDGGMCIQHAAFLVHILTVMGYQARHVNIIAHEVVEVWSDDFDKWVYLDPTQGVDCYLYDTRTGIPLSLDEMHKAYYTLYGVNKPIDWMVPTADWYTLERDYSRLPISMSTTDPRIMLRHEKNGMLLYYDLCAFLRMMPRNNFSTTSIPEPLQQGNYCPWPWDGYINWYDQLAPPKLQYSNHTDRVCDFWPTLNRVRFEAVPEVNGDAVFMRMITFTPSFKTFQVKIDDNDWVDSDEHYTWRLHEGKNRLEMRAVTRFGVTGNPSFIECNVVSKPIPKPVGIGTMNQ
ncbi:transglutaminase-like domain-containing protein, partial [Candidatus Omnitrophota bacterium]